MLVTETIEIILSRLGTTTALCGCAAGYVQVPLFFAYAKQVYLCHVMRKPTFWLPTWSDTNQAVQLQKMARGLKFRIYVVKGLYYLCSENKGADQLREADLCLCFRICKTLVSHDPANL